jgi:hypothetical protein
VTLLHPDLERCLAPGALDGLDLDDGGAQAARVRWARARAEALDRAEREGLRPGQPAWGRVDAPHVAEGRTLAVSLEARADRDERAALERRAAVLRAAAPATLDLATEGRRREAREQLRRQAAEPSDRLRTVLAAVRDGTPAHREHVDAVLTEPLPRELLTESGYAEVGARVVARRAPEVLQAAYRARVARRVAMDIRNAIGDPTFIKV